MEVKLEFLKTIADETRLKILNRLMESDSYVEKLAIELSLTPATICYHLKKLVNVGAVNCSRAQFYIIYCINRDVFNRTLTSLITTDAPDSSETEKYAKTVISHFFKYGKLMNIPTQQKKREIVMKEIAKAFEPNKPYSETETNEIIHRFHEDHCTIRREMIAFGLMKRDNDTYTTL